MRGLSMLFLFFLIIGGLNWGIIGVTPSWFNVIHWIVRYNWIERLIYIIVGIGAIWWIFAWSFFTGGRKSKSS